MRRTVLDLDAIREWNTANARAIYAYQTDPPLDPCAWADRYIDTPDVPCLSPATSSGLCSGHNVWLARLKAAGAIE